MEEPDENIQELIVSDPNAEDVDLNQSRIAKIQNINHLTKLQVSKGFL